MVMVMVMGGGVNDSACGATLQLGADVAAAAAAAAAGLQRTARNAQPWPVGGCCAMIAVPDSLSPAVDPGAGGVVSARCPSMRRRA
jgi:hypothetical protein